MQEKLKKFRLVKLSLGLALLFLAALCFLNHFYSWQGNKIETISIGEKIEIKAEKVVSDQKRYQGLSGRDSLCKNCGMLFIMPETAQQVFSMRGMRFGLDFIWIKDGQIVALNKNVPWNYSGKIIADYPSEQVLEVLSGTCDKYGIEVGDKLF